MMFRPQACHFVRSGLFSGLQRLFVFVCSGNTSRSPMAQKICTELGLDRDTRVRKLSFTGSTEVGRTLLNLANEHIVNASMELGGNAPFVVFVDADLDAVIEGAMIAKMRNGGEACAAANRFFVQNGIVDAFAARLTEAMNALTMGPGYLEGTTLGPLVNAASRDKIASLVDQAVDTGARLRTGGTVPEGDGYFYPPTVLTGVPTSAKVFREEIFGPVAPIITFDTDQDGIDKANDTEYGLVAYAFTENLTRALTVAEKLETGMVGINQGIVSNPAAPFGGVKASGLGREGGTEGIEEYLETKYVGIKL